MYKTRISLLISEKAISSVTKGSMFMNSVEVISSRLDNLKLNVTKMHPIADRPPVCPKNQVPLFQLTPSNSGPKKNESSSPQSTDSPWLLKPQHKIPTTPPPQSRPQPFDFQQKSG